MIFVEGIADVVFIQQYIESQFGIKLTTSQIKHTGGWNAIDSKTDEGEALRIAMSQNSDNEGLNLVIFDADNDYSARYEEINGWKLKHSLEFELFLFPNNSDIGALEDLLENIINPINQPIFDCWSGFENCINSKEIQDRIIPLTIPAKKTKIYAYLETLLGSSKSEKEKIKEVKRNYKNLLHWDLTNEYLLPLKDFLTIT